MWWLGLSKEVAQQVKDCEDYSREFAQKFEPLMPMDLPEYPWQQVGTDLFTFKGKEYLIVVDYFSQYPEIVRLPSTTSQVIILAIKVFSQYGIPKRVRSDNVPQYSLAPLMDSNILPAVPFPSAMDAWREQYRQ